MEEIDDIGNYVKEIIDNVWKEFPNISDARKDIKEFVVNILVEHDFNYDVNINIWSIDKQKTVFKMVKYISTNNDKETLDCYVNEKLYDRLDVSYRKYLIENAFSGVCFDSEKGKLTVDQPDMAVSSRCYEVYKEKLSDSVFAEKMMYETILAEEKAEEESSI